MTDIFFDRHNYRNHTEKNLNLIKKSLKTCGTGRSIVIDADNEIVAGNATYKTAKELNIPIKIIETDGTALIVLKRIDLRTQDRRRKELAVMDNSTSDHVDWDLDNLASDFELSELTGYGLEEVVAPTFTDSKEEQAKEVRLCPHCGEPING